MLRSKSLPTMTGTFVRWIDCAHFIVDVGGIEIIAHRAHWTGDFPEYETDVKPNG